MLLLLLNVVLPANKCSISYNTNYPLLTNGVKKNSNKVKRN